MPRSQASNLNSRTRVVRSAGRRDCARSPDRGARSMAAVSHNRLANLLLATGQFEEAKAEFVGQSDLNPAAGPEIDIEIGFILILEHRFDDAFASIERWPVGDDKNEAVAMIGRAIGRKAEADAASKALKSQAGLASVVRLAEVHAVHGELEEAFHALQRARTSTMRDSWSSPDSNGYGGSTSRRSYVRSIPIRGGPRCVPRLQRSPRVRS